MQPSELVRRDSPPKQVGLRGSRIGASQYGSERKIWRPTGVRDLSLEQSNHERMERRSPTKSYDMGSASITNSRMHRARSTAVLAPYEESVASQSQVISK